MLWSLLQIVNFPLSLLLEHVGCSISGWREKRGLPGLGKHRWQSVDNFWMPLVLYGIFGTLWWAGIAWGITGLVL